MAASTFCPLLVVGVWWAAAVGARGATAGLVTGGVLALTATTITVLGGPGSVGGGWLGAFAGPSPPRGPSRPLFLVAVLVSYATPGSVPAGTSRTMVRLHAPEDLRAPEPPERRPDGGTGWAACQDRRPFGAAGQPFGAASSRWATALPPGARRPLPHAYRWVEAGRATGGAPLPCGCHSTEVSP